MHSQFLASKIGFIAVRLAHDTRGIAVRTTGGFDLEIRVKTAV